MINRLAKYCLLFASVLVVFVVVGSLLWPRKIDESPPVAEAARGPDIQGVVSAFDAEFRQHWQSTGSAIAQRADDLTLARRLSLALIGTIPSLEELRALEQRPAGHRFRWWLERLLEDKRHSDYFAERLKRAFVGADGGPFLVYRQRRFTLWLSEQLAANVPYDELASQLISEVGLWNSSPAVNFLTVTAEEDDQPDEMRLAGRTARAFLGMRIDCLQCHDDRLGNVDLGKADDPRDGLQSDFHQLASFFGEASLSITGIKDNQEQEYRFQYLDQDGEQVIPPRVPYRSDLLPSEGTLRERLAGWVTHRENKPFARAIVNRYWALLFGRPLVEPIDDISLHGPHSPGLEKLADDFIEHDFDLRRLIRVIASTEAFQLNSKASFEVTPHHEQHWSVFPLTRLRPEQVAGSIVQAASLRAIDGESATLFQLAKFFQSGDFVRRYGDVGEDEFADRGGTVTQRLLMLNGDLLSGKVDDQPLFNASARIARLAPDDETAVEVAYLTVLTRRPSQREKQYFTERLSKQTRSERGQGLSDLFWVLMNSTEFSWNH